MKEIIGIWWLNDIIFVYKRKLQMLQASKMFGHFAGFADAYDVIVGSGIFAPGHVKEDCFEELVRIVKPGKTMILPPPPPPPPPPPRVLHICVSGSGQHWFRWWLGAYSATSHYLNQYWVIVNWTFRNKLQCNFNQNTKLFIHENAFEGIDCEMVAICPGGC